MRALTLLLLTASPAAAQYGAYFTITNDAAPRFLRVHRGTGAAYEVQPVITGHQQMFGGAAYNGSDVYRLDNTSPDRLLRIDVQTGAAAVVGPTGFDWSSCSLDVGYNARLHAIADNNNLYTIEMATGQTALTATLFGSPRLDQVTDLAVSGNDAFITDTTDNDLFSLNVLTGQVTWIASAGGQPFVDLTAVFPNGLFGVRADGGIYSIDRATAATTLLFPGNHATIDLAGNGAPWCYANCDGSTTLPVLTPNDFMCYLHAYMSNLPYGQCTGSSHGSTSHFVCYYSAYNAGCN